MKTILFSFLLLSVTLNAQNISKNIQTINGNKYYIHTVGNCESIRKIGEYYAVSARDILSDNPDAKSGVKLGQSIKVLYSEYNKDYIYDEAKINKRKKEELFPPNEQPWANFDKDGFLCFYGKDGIIGQKGKLINIRPNCNYDSIEVLYAFTQSKKFLEDIEQRVLDLERAAAYKCDEKKATNILKYVWDGEVIYTSEEAIMKCNFDKGIPKDNYSSTILRKTGLVAEEVKFLSNCSFNKKVYYESGVIKSTVTLNEKMIKNGALEYYFESGNIARKAAYKDDKLNGELVFYFENGNIKYKANFIDSKQVGDIIYNNGTIEQILKTPEDKKKVQSDEKLFNEISSFTSGSAFFLVNFEKEEAIRDSIDKVNLVRGKALSEALNKAMLAGDINVFSKDQVYSSAQLMPEFMGGYSKMMAFISKQIQYPQSAKEAGISGVCYLKFIVTPIGSIRDIEVIKGVSGCEECDNEAIRVIKMMPSWHPGIQNEKAVSVYYNLEINFKLN